MNRRKKRGVELDIQTWKLEYTAGWMQVVRARLYATTDDLHGTKLYHHEFQ